MRAARVLAGLVVALLLPAAAATAQTSSPTGSRPERPPSLERFTAQFEAKTGATRYTAVARDPDGGAVSYRWSLKASCGFLANPAGTGPTNVYEHGPKARKPGGCPSDAEAAASLTLTVADPGGCAVEYTQRARDETVHVRPKTRALPCPPRAAAAEDGGGFPAGLLVLVILAVGAAALYGVRVLRAKGAPPARPSSKPDGVEEFEPEPQPLLGEALFEPVVEGCFEGSVRNETTEVVAHETVLAGAVIVTATSESGTRMVELTESTETTRAELVASLGIAAGRAVDLRAEVPVRASTAVCARRESCKAGKWTPEASSNVRDGAERSEVLRAAAASPEDFDRFLDEVLGPRLASLRKGRRRIEAALAECVPAEPAPEPKPIVSEQP